MESSTAVLLMQLAILVAISMVSYADESHGYGTCVGCSENSKVRTSGSTSGSSASGCVPCQTPDGSEYQDGESFVYTDGCIEYSRCQCYCGHYQCFGGKDVCRATRQEANRRNGGCLDCMVRGIVYRPNAPFDYRRGCEEMKDCFCSCDGSWYCNVVRDICNPEKGQYTYTETQTHRSGGSGSTGSGSSSSSQSSSSGGGSYSVSSSTSEKTETTYTSSSSSSRDQGASGRDQSGSGYSSTSYGWRSTGGSSSSGSSGQSSSSRTSSSSASRTSGSRNVITSPRTRVCRACNIGSERFEGDSYFRYTNNCIEYEECYCNCDGYWQCPLESGRYVCDGQLTGSGYVAGQARADGCRSCQVMGQLYTPNRQFTFVNGCMEWSQCQCRCDGGWSCPGDKGRWVCDNVCRDCQTTSGDYLAEGNSIFTYKKDCIEYDRCECRCNGSWSCPAESGKWVCTDRCSECNVRGNRYQGNSTFPLREDCWEWDPCHCLCNGSWHCPKENARWACTDRCRTCEVDGRSYPGNRRFTLQEDCFQYNCDCNCDGSYNCPAERTVDTCNRFPGTECYYCQVHGERFNPNQPFIHEDGCIRYDCDCKCDGSWECPGERAVDTCRRNSSMGCYFCDVDGTAVEGNSLVQIDRNCWRYECKCDCNGQLECSTAPVYTCGSQLQTSASCRQCLVAGEIMEGGSSFQLEYGCIQYNCQCLCDGSYVCPAASARSLCASSVFERFQIVSISNRPLDCKTCSVNGAVYPGNSEYEYTEGCVRHYVRCYCNGGYRFASSPVANCNPDDSRSSACKSCKMNSISHAPNARFDLKYGCIVYSCTCECDGVPNCVPSKNQICGTSVQVLRRLRTDSSETRTRTRVIERVDSRTQTGGGGTGSDRTQGGRVQTGSRTTVITDGSGGRVGGSTVIGGSSSRTTTTTRVGGSSGSRGSTRTVSVETNVPTVTRGGSTVISSSSSTDRSTSGMQVTGSVDRTRSTGGSTVITEERRVTGETSVGPLRCLGCIVRGQQYAVNQQFDYHSSCVRYQCTCECTTGARCEPVGFDIYSEGCERGPQCTSSCLVGTSRYRAQEQFTIRRGCNMLSCLCQCNGKAACISSEIPNCQRRPGFPRLPTSQEGVCRNCYVDNQEYRGDTEYTIQRDCLRYQCRCDCNGTHYCSEPVNTCQTNPEYPQCYACIIGGRRYTLNERFEYQHGCWRMQCRCGCQAELNCDRATAVYTCPLEPGRPEEPICNSCTIGRYTVPPERKFTKREGCYEYKCQCFCSGDHDCVRTGTNVCLTGSVFRATSEIMVDTSEVSDSGSTMVVVRQPGSTTTTTRRVETTYRVDGDGGVTTVMERETQDQLRERLTREELERQHLVSRERLRQQELEQRRERERIEREESERLERLHAEERLRQQQLEEQERLERERIDREERERLERAHVAERERLRRIELEEKRRHERERQEIEERLNQQHLIDRERLRQQEMLEEQQRLERERVEREERERLELQERERLRQQELEEQERLERERQERERQHLVEQDRLRQQEIAEQERLEREKVERERLEQEERQRATERERERIERERTERERVERERTERERIERERIERERTNQGSGTEDCDGSCSYGGKNYPGDSVFFVERQCLRYRCHCYCNGRIACETGSPENICEDGSSSTSGRESSGSSESRNEGSSSSSSRTSTSTSTSRTTVYYEEFESRSGYTRRSGAVGCVGCEVGGRNQSGNSVFNFDDGCKRFAGCRCQCNGDWECPRQKPIKLCNDEEEAAQRARDRSTIRTQDGSSSSSTRDDYYSRSEVSSYYGVYETRSGARTSSAQGSGGCYDCIVQGRTYPSQQEFMYNEDCKRFRCSCHCDGSWECPRQRPGRLCADETGSSQSSGSSESSSSSSSSTSSSSSSERSFTNAEESSSYFSEYEERSGSNRVATGSVCDSCMVAGERFPGNNDFEYREGCKLFTNCFCSCNGDWRCPLQQPRRLCGSEGGQVCMPCLVRGQEHQANQNFSIQLNDCTAYRCFCPCNQTYQCYEAVNTCQGQNIRNPSCKECRSPDGRTHQPNRQFQYEERCYRFNCDCNCDGSYNCPAERTIDTCNRQPDTGGERGCRECIVSGQRHQPNRPFQYEDGCYTFNCDCNCDGSYNCPAERTVDNCNNRQPDTGRRGCRECIVQGERHQPNRPFQYDDGCYTFNCDCNCDGSYNCPAERTVDNCNNRQPDTGGRGCRECTVNGRKYQPNRQFQYEDGCYRFSCDCNCDGSYNCPAERTIDNCRRSALSAPTSCMECEAGGQRYVPNERFEYTDNCKTWTCACHCNGTKTCELKSIDMNCGTNWHRCSQCHVQGKTYEPYERFNYTERCHQRECLCGCNGRPSCPHHSVRNICEQTNGKCLDCDVRGVTYSGDSVFVLREQCLQYQCRCECNAKWHCDRNKTVNVCSTK